MYLLGVAPTNSRSLQFLCIQNSKHEHHMRLMQNHDSAFGPWTCFHLLSVPHLGSFRTSLVLESFRLGIQSVLLDNQSCELVVQANTHHENYCRHYWPHHPRPAILLGRITDYKLSDCPVLHGLRSRTQSPRYGTCGLWIRTFSS